MELPHPYTMAAASLIWEKRKFLFTASNPGQGRQWCLSAWLRCTFQFPPLFSVLLSPLLGHSQTGCVWKWEAAEQAGFAEVILKKKTMQPQKKPKAIAPTFNFISLFYFVSPFLQEELFTFA